MNIDFIGILLLNFILGHLLNIEIPKEILEFYEKYKDKDPENHLYEIAPFINDYYEKLKKDFELKNNEK